MSEYVLEMEGISKSFPGVQALDDVSLKVRPGEVLALMGENGAGKSTLMKCLVGLYKPDAGRILLDGKEVEIPNPAFALNNGISMIHQELNPVMDRSVMENIWLGRFPQKGYGPFRFVDHAKMREDTARILKELFLALDPLEKVGNLTIATMQMVEIAKAVSYNSRIIVMDEPTSSLTDNEIANLFFIIERLKKQGVAIIYISHKMDEIFRVSDSVTVMRDGKVAGNSLASSLTIDTLIRMMVGREIVNLFPKKDVPIGEVKMRVENLSSPDAFEDVSFELRRGEILGLAGLVGAGRTELMEALFGVRKTSSGKVFIDGAEVTIKNPADAKRKGLAFLTEDRRKTGIIDVASVQDNTVIANLRAYFRNRLGMLDFARIRKDTQNYNARLRTKTPDYETRIQNLSGGNQQKVLVARWLLTNPDILILDEPTRGIDVGAKAEIHTIITDLAAEGKAILMVSSELPEILGMSDRILVMHEGRQTAIIDRKDASQELIMQYATASTDAS